MSTSGLMICSFYLKTRHLREEQLYSLNQDKEIESDGEIIIYDSVFEMLSEFFEKYYSFDDDLKHMRMFRIDENSIQKHMNESYTSVSFTIKSGVYGLKGSITNRTTQRVNYERSIEDADIKAFKCLIYVPKDTPDTVINKGIIIFQSIATYGVKTVTVRKMKDFFAEKNLTLETRSVSVRTFIEKLVDEGKLEKLTLIKNRVSRDSSDNIFISTGREEHSYLRPHLKESWFSKLLHILENPIDKTQIFEIDDEDYEDIKVTFKLGKSMRTVALRHIDRFSVVEELPDDIFNNGTYIEDELIKYMIETAETYKEKMVFEISK